MTLPCDETNCESPASYRLQSELLSDGYVSRVTDEICCERHAAENHRYIDQHEKMRLDVLEVMVAHFNEWEPENEIWYRDRDPEHDLAQLIRYLEAQDAHEWGHPNLEGRIEALYAALAIVKHGKREEQIVRSWSEPWKQHS